MSILSTWPLRTRRWRNIYFNEESSFKTHCLLCVCASLSWTWNCSLTTVACFFFTFYYDLMHGCRNGGCVGCDRTPLSTKNKTKKVRNSIIQYIRDLVDVYESDLPSSVLGRRVPKMEREIFACWPVRATGLLCEGDKSMWQIIFSEYIYIIEACMYLSGD